MRTIYSCISPEKEGLELEPIEINEKLIKKSELDKGEARCYRLKNSWNNFKSGSHLVMGNPSEGSFSNSNYFTVVFLDSDL
jgi:hypothetical protein